MHSVLLEYFAPVPGPSAERNDSELRGAIVRL